MENHPTDESDPFLNANEFLDQIPQHTNNPHVLHFVQMTRYWLQTAEATYNSRETDYANHVTEMDKKLAQCRQQPPIKNEWTDYTE